MIKVIFKDLEKSELAKEAAIEHVETLISRFPDLEGSKITMTLSMDNSPTQAGPDLFSVKFQCKSGKYKGVILEKYASNYYKALAALSDNLLERLNRFGDKKRVQNRKKARQLLNFTNLENPTPI